MIGGAILALIAALIAIFFFPISFKDDTGQWLMALLGAWFIFLFIFVSPYLLWKRLRGENAKLKGAMSASQQKHINIDWRSTAQGEAQLIITNDGPDNQTIQDVEVMVRNWRHASGEHVEDILTILKPISGRQPPIKLHPGDPNYFVFASVKRGSNGNAKIAIVPGYPNERQPTQKEIGIKLSVSGENFRGGPIVFRLKLDDNNALIIEPWEAGEKAVPNEEIGV